MVQSSDPSSLVQASLNAELSGAEADQVRLEAELQILQQKLHDSQSTAQITEECNCGAETDKKAKDGPPEVKENTNSKADKICKCKPGKPSKAEQEIIITKKEKYREEVERIKTEVEIKKKMASEISTKI